MLSFKYSNPSSFFMLISTLVLNFSNLCTMSSNLRLFSSTVLSYLFHSILPKMYLFYTFHKLQVML